MDELILELKTKANLTDEQALLVVQTMKEYIHSKVPPMFSGFVDTFFAGNGPAAHDDVLLP